MAFLRLPLTMRRASAAGLGVLLAGAATLGVLTLTGRPNNNAVPATERLSAHLLPCGVAQVVSVDGWVARIPDRVQTPIAHGITPLATSPTSTLYIVDRGVTAPSGVVPSAVTVPSRVPAYRSCNYSLSDNARDSAFKASAAARFYAEGLVAPERLSEPGVIWMVADDPTSATDILVLADVETPRTAASIGTIKTIVAVVDLTSGKLLGAAAANW